jgi:transmembrane sensor
MIMDRDRIWILMARKFAEELTDDEMRELEQLLKGNPPIHFPLQTLSDLWTREAYPKETVTADEASELAYAAHMQKLRSISPVAQEKKQRNLLPYLFTLLGVVTITYLLLPLKAVHNQTGHMKEIVTTPVTRSMVTLPDGSQVWVNAGSRLEYKENFGVEDRLVKLTGEAYFIVTPNEQQPFFIETSLMHLKVLGTTFNVKSYPGEQTSEAALISGSLEILLTAGKRQKIILHPGEKLMVFSAPMPASKIPKPGKSVDEPRFELQHITYFGDNKKIIAETSWINNQLVVQNQKLEGIVTAMRKRYGTTIKFEDEALKQLNINGVFRDKTIEQTLDDMSAGGLFTYHITGKQILISRK